MDVRSLRDGSPAQKYKRDHAESLGESDDFDDLEKFFTDFKPKVMKVLFARYTLNAQELSDQEDTEYYLGETQG